MHAQTNDPTTAPPLPLLVQSLTKHFRQGRNQVQALRGVDLSLSQGKLLAIMGASGSGKSTLLHLLAGLTQPTDGAIHIAGHPLSGMTDRQLTRFRRRHIGLVFQAFNLVPTLTAAQNIALPLSLAGMSSRLIQQRVQPLLEMLGITDRATHRPDALSGGEQQRVAIARALAGEPNLILADEPTGNLDSENSRIVCRLIRTLCHQQQRAIVMVTHEPAVAVWADQVAVMQDGQIIGYLDIEARNDPETLGHAYQQLIRRHATDEAGS